MCEAVVGDTGSVDMLDKKLLLPVTFVRMKESSSLGDVFDFLKIAVMLEKGLAFFCCIEGWPIPLSRRSSHWFSRMLSRKVIFLDEGEEESVVGVIELLNVLVESLRLKSILALLLKELIVPVMEPRCWDC